MNINRVYEDDDMVVLDKPEGIATIPERFEREHCLLNQLAQTVSYKPYVVHRIDKPVSGAIIFAKNAQSHRYLCMAFQEGRVEKTYLALVHGLPPESEGTIDFAIRRFGSGRMGIDSRRGKPCRTDFAVIEKCGAFALLRVWPRTGRRHQIRVHLYGIGHPIAGDAQYGDTQVQAHLPRLMLHASHIKLQGRDGHEVSISAPLPASYSTVLAQVRAGEFDRISIGDTASNDHTTEETL